MLLSRFPRTHIAHLPTPLERLDRLSETLGGPTIWMKRDDCTGLAGGGNKTRKLEFLVGDALEKGAGTLVTPGAIQSNHARQTAAAAARHGLRCHLVLENRTGHGDVEYLSNGNVLLDHLFGATIEIVPEGASATETFGAAVARLEEEGAVPYPIPGGGSNEIGALGYVNCALELLGQANDTGLAIDHVVTATGSAGTQGGLIVGLKATHSGIPLLGIGVGAPREKQEEKVFDLACETAEYIGVPGIVQREDVIANCDYVGEAYGIPTDAMNDAVMLLARLEGLLFDPVYSGKAFHGMLQELQRDRARFGERVVFLHTGGIFGLLAKSDELSPLL